MNRIFWVAIFLWNICVFSQEKAHKDTYTQKSLRNVLKTLEDHYGVKFSYVDEIIKHKEVNTKYDTALPLPTLLKKLERDTQLRFEIVEGQFIVIRDYNAEDKITICGYILDAYEQPFKEVSLLSEGENITVKLDENGFFELKKIPFKAILYFKGLGTKTYEVEAKSLFKEKMCKPIYLIENIETLDEIFIKEYIAKGIILTNRSIRIKLRELGILPGLTEPDILRSVQLSPGINTPFETASGIYVRGSVPHQNLVLWNGIKTYSQGHFFGVLSAFNPYVAKEANFIKSGSSARYGDRIASIIDIKTDDEVISEFTGGVGINMLNGDISLGIPLIKDKLSLQVSGRRSYTDFFQTITYDQLSKNVFQNTKIEESDALEQSENDFFFSDYNINMIGKLGKKDKIRFNSIYAMNDLDFNVVNDELLLRDQLKTENEGLSVEWSRVWNDKMSHSVKGYYSKYLLSYKFITIPVFDDIEENSKLNRIRDYGVEVDWEYNFNNYRKLIAGYHLSNNFVEYGFRSKTPNLTLILDEDSRKLNTHALYAEYQYTNPQQMYVSLGMRVNRYEEINKTYVEPRLYMTKNFTKNFLVKASAEFKSQAINQIRESVISDLTLENEVWRLTNGDSFPVVNSAQVTLGASYKKKTWYFDIDGYYKHIHGITTLTSGFINPVDNEFHIGESKIYGLDFFVKKEINAYKTWLSYSFINARNKFETINSDTFFPGNWNIRHTLKWTQSYTYKNLKLSLGWLWHTGKPFTEVEAVDIEDGIPVLKFDQINAYNLPVYHRMDFSALYDFKLNQNNNIKYQVGVSVLNLYNEKNILNKEFRTTASLEQRFISREVQSLGITPNFSFRMFW